MLDRAGVARLAQQRLEQFFAEPPREAYKHSLKMTSGTTSEPLLSMLDNQPQYFEALREYHRYVVLHPSRAIRLANAVYACHQRTAIPLRAMLVDPSDLVPGFDELLADFSPDAIRGFPSFVIRAAERLPIAITAEVAEMHLAGELITNARAAFLHEHFPRTRFKCTYMSAELGMLSEVSCPFAPFNYYHPRKGVTIDIDAPDEDGVGSILVTVDLGGGIRAERYRIGDSARWISEPCPCGEPRMFEVLGREGFDYIKIAGCIVRAEEGERIFSRYKHLFQSYRIELEEAYDAGVMRGRLTLRTYSDAWKISDEEIRVFLQYFSDNFFMTPTKTLSVLVREGVFEPVVFVQEASPLQQGAKAYPLRFKK